MRRQFRRRVLFKKRTAIIDLPATRDTTEQQRQRQTPTMLHQEENEDEIFIIPAHFRNESPIEDGIISASSEAQQETVNECLPLLTAALNPQCNPLDFNEFGLPTLRIEDHVSFLRQNLSRFPAKFVGLDASRPWLVYWGLMGLYFLGEETGSMRSRFVCSPCMLRTVLIISQCSEHILPAAQRKRWLRRRSWTQIPPGHNVWLIAEYCAGRRRTELSAHRSESHVALARSLEAIQWGLPDL